MSRGIKTKNFPNWFAGFAKDMEDRGGIRVTLRDSNAMLYRNLYDRGHSPEGASSLMR